MEFETRGQCQGHIDNRLKLPLGFCPVIRKICNPDCVCYQSATPVTTKRRKNGVWEEVWMVKDPLCQHAMIYGAVK